MKKIDGSRIYVQGEFSYKNFTSLSDEESRMVMNWRNDPKIRMWMSNDDVIPLDDHLKFIAKLSSRKDVAYWLTFHCGKPVGVFDLASIDQPDGSAVIGYYLAPDFIGTGFGMPFMLSFRTFFFDILGFETLYSYVLEGNTRAFQMSEFYGERPYGSFVEDGRRYLCTKSIGKEFKAMPKDGLIQRFVQFCKENPVDWDMLFSKYQK
jgi:UDP-4-amino-4,6-dideoxy-N-acetyl-beta-L-altrosamine N-acetyltransferase